MAMQQTKEENKANTTKELWQVYNVYDFIDAKDNQGDWRVGYIIEKNPNTKFYKIRFDGWGSKYDQIYRFTSNKLSEFRSIVIGYTGQRKNPGIRNDWKFTLKSHAEKMEMLQEYCTSENKTAWEINQFFRGHNYIYTDFLMTQVYDNIEDIAAVMEYFLANARMVMKYLKTVDPQFKKYYRSLQIPQQSFIVDPQSAKVHSFYEIMDTLYTLSGNYPRLDSFFSKNATLLRKSLNIDFEKNVRRYYQMRILEQVMKQEGIEIIWDLINEKLKNSKCVIPFLFLKSLTCLYVGLGNQTQYKQKKPVLDKLVQITKQNTAKLDDKYLKDINKNHVADLLQTFRNAYQNTEDEQTIKNWTLQQQVKLYQKMVACPYFDKKLKGVIGFQELIQKNKMQPNAETFVNILLKQKIFDVLFSADNAQIIRKSVQFCKSLYFNDMFPQDVAFRIWALREGKHEAALQQLFALISVLPSKYNHSDFEKKLFDQISKQPSDQWDEDYIKMIKQYSLTAVGWVSADDKQPAKYGFDILYNYAITRKTDFAINSFIQLLNRFQKTEVMVKFINHCFEKINNNEDSYIYVILLLKIIDENLSQMKEVSDKASGVVVKDLLNNSNDTLQKNTKRFELLTQITKLTNTNVSFEEFMELWNQFKEKPSEKSCQDWILNKKDGDKSSINQRIGSDIRKLIFEKIWNENYDYSKISQKQATIFIQFFKSTNVYEGKIKKLNVIIKIDDLDLVGFDKIWKAFQTVQNEKIAYQLAQLIAEIHMCPTKGQQSQKQNWVNNLISQFSKKISQAYAQKDFNRVKRLLIIPSKIIERDQQIFTTKPGRSYIMKQYKVININTKQEKLIKFNHGGLTYDFKKLISEKFKVPFRRCKLSCKGQLIKYQNYFKSLIQCAFSNAPFELEVIEDEVPSVKKCLNSELQTFFQLLGDPQLERSVWEIIQRLPIAEDFLMKLSKSEHPWQQINNSSIYKQLYILRVMGYLSRDWWVEFCAGPGLLNLTKKFSKVTAKSKVQREYLKVLCQSIQQCLDIQASLDQINMEDLITSMLKSLNDLLEGCAQEELVVKKHSVQVSIVSSMFNIFKKLQNQVNTMKVLIQKFDDKVGLISKGLITVKNQHIRKEFMLKLKFISGTIAPQNTQIYQGIIYRDIFNLATTYPAPEQTHLYFQYASNLLEIISKEDFKKYLKDTNDELVKQSERGLYLEKPEINSETVNYHLVGYLMLMKKLVQFCSPKEKEAITDFLLYKCFFPHLQSQNSEVYCKCKQTKSAAFQLLNALIADGQSSLKAIQTLSSLHKNALWRTRRTDDWTLTPGQKVKSASGYVGIKNLGCICYMNSLFQQIFMIPNFRQAILQCEDPLQNKEVLQQNVLYQLKKMFFSLLLSQKKYYVPTDFCHSFKNYEGQPTNVYEQMDIDQFSGILFDRLENQIKGTRYENIIKDFFGGVFSNEIICKGCPHFSETEESFLSISLNVKSKKNIYQSFDAMIKGDTLDGDNAYFCQRCNKKVSAVKRVCLKKLPDHLILTLKRFQFDYETMSKNKLNDYCQFPTQLNVKQYSQQYLRKQENPDRFDDEEMVPDSYYDYTLQGVVIHIGHADSGHYFSYIRERKEDGKWFQFNDTIVRPFDIRKLAEEAFGGEMGTLQVKQKIKNAYMLIYERKKKIVDHSKLINMGRNLTDIPIYADLKQQIQNSNVLQKIQNILFSTEYTKFAGNLIKNVQNMPAEIANEALKYAVEVYLTVTIRQKQQISSFEFLKGLHKVLSNYPAVQQWIITIFSAQKSLIQFFKNNPAKEVKKLLAHWLSQLAQSVSQEKKLTFVDSLIAFMVINNENTSQFCQILFELMANKQVCQYVISKHIIGVLIQNMLPKERPLFKSTQQLCVIESAQDQIGKQVIIQKTQYQLSKKLKVFQQTPYVWGVISRVVDFAELQNKKLKDILLKEEMELIYLPINKIYKILEECRNKFMINKFCKLLTHLGKGNLKFTEQVMNLGFLGLKQFQSKRYRQFFILLNRFIKQQKNEFILRKGLDSMVRALRENEKYAVDSNIIQQWIIKCARKNKLLQQFISQSPEYLKYLGQLPCKKLPTDQISRKNTLFQETTVNKFHGIKMMKNKKGYETLGKKMEKFYADIAEQKEIESYAWDSDEDLTQQKLKIGQTVAYFDSKDKIQFLEGKVQDMLLTRLWITVNKTKMPAIWQDDQKLTSKKYPFEDVESDDELADSQNTTQMEYDEDLIPVI